MNKIKTCITKNSLAKILQDIDGEEKTFNSPDKYRQKTSRFVTGGMTYGLITLDLEAERQRSNNKPLQGTQRLHEFLIELGDQFNKWMSKSFSYSDILQNANNDLSPAGGENGTLAH